jgi:sugar lactone lactonase YvrE
LSCDPRLALLAALALAACPDTELPGPLPEQIDPTAGPADRWTPVLVSGRGFIPLVQANFDDESKAGVSTAFILSLGHHRLQKVLFLDNTRLGATVPAGLAPGIYDLTVTGPRGRTGRLTQAFTVQGLPPDAGRPDVDKPDAGGDLAPDGDGPDLSPEGGPPSDAMAGVMVSTFAGSGIAGFKDGPTAGAQFINPRGIAVSGSTVYIGDYSNQRIRAIAAGTVTTVAGSGLQGLVDGPAASAKFSFPVGVAVDSSGTVFVADSANDVIRSIAAGTVSTFAGSGTKGFLDDSAAAAQFNFPHGLAVEGNGVYVADTYNHRIRLIQGGMVSTFAGSGVQGFLDGPVASARFGAPTGLAWAGGVLYVADSGNNRIRAISGGSVTTVAGTGVANSTDGPALTKAAFFNPAAVAATAGKIYVAAPGNHRIRVIEQGVVSTIAGSSAGFADGPAWIAKFQFPSGLTLGPAGELYVTDQSNHRIRVITF